MTPPRGICEFCEKPILSYERAAWPVTGWEEQRDQGGANQITAKKRMPNRIAHQRCLQDHLRRSVHEQLELG